MARRLLLRLPKQTHVDASPFLLLATLLAEGGVPAATPLGF
jgi:hypothetical protein